MKILLHTCCAPCTVYPAATLAAAGHQVRGFFCNPNIHPYQEFARRLAAMEEYVHLTGLPMIWDASYPLEDFLRDVLFREAERCRFCYHRRLEAAAKTARAGKFDAFTTTLLYSKFQQHDLIRELGEVIGRAVGLPFYYEDFRTGWAAGRARAKEIGLYQQQYCGCIFSERDRYQPAGASRETRPAAKRQISTQEAGGTKRPKAGVHS